MTLSLQANNPEAEHDWIQLFNGKNLDGWTVKIKGYEMGKNFGDTFRVKNGKIVVSYDKYDQYDNRPGYLFYNKPFSHYVLRAEYRFVGEQLEGGPNWARRNSGIMIHSQPPASMKKDQENPTCLEAQLLGGYGEQERSTANLCTLGMVAVMNDELTEKTCIGSSSDTYYGDQWVSVKLVVRGNERITHFVEGKKVIEYTNPQLEKSNKELTDVFGGMEISEGYIALQSESHPIEFRNIRLRKLDK